MRSFKTFFERQNVFSPLMPVGFILAILCFSAIQLSAQSGTVFRDYDGDGTKGSAEPLVAGIVVNAYNAAGSLCGTATTTDVSAPNYSITGTCSGSVRVEFVIPASGVSCDISSDIDYPSTSGGVYGSEVQFVLASATNVNFAVQYPSEYGGISSYIPPIVTAEMVTGDPLGGGTAADLYSVIKTSYADEGEAQCSFSTVFLSDPANIALREVGHVPLAKASQTGTLWGTVYSKKARRLFLSAFLRRHAGLGPLGSGGIYMLDPNNPDLLGSYDFANLDALGFPTHASGAYGVANPLHVGTNAERLLPANPFNAPTSDAPAYDQVGKVSLGAMELSENGRYLFVVNLYDRKIYRIDLQNASSPVAPTAAQVTSYSIPDPCTGANAGEYRPFALKVYRGRLYVGVICSGQNAALAEIGTSSTMSMNVYAFDLNATNVPSGPQIVLSEDLSYRDGQNLHALGIPGTWVPWQDEFSTSIATAMLTDIEFDADGNVIIGLTDRNSYQTGSANYDLNGAGSNTKAYANGDMVHFTKSAVCGYTITNNDYYDDCITNVAADCPPFNPCAHNETSLGPIAVHRFSNRDVVIGTVLNPLAFTSNGYMLFDGDNGSKIRGNEIWYDQFFDTNPSPLNGKAGGLGDIEFMNSSIAPLEIGNRVWMDTDNDGIQDADEMGIGSIPVKLYKAGVQVGATTTAADGTYYFNDSNVTMNGASGILPEMAYEIRIDAADFPSGKVLSVQTNITGAGQPDISDNDAVTSGGNAVISLTTGKQGANNHTYDFAFSACLPVACGGTTVIKN